MINPVAEDLQEGIAHQRRLRRKTAANGPVVPFGHRVKQPAELRGDVDEIAIDGKDVLPTRRCIPVTQRAAHSRWWLTSDQLDSQVHSPPLRGHFCRPVGAVVVNDYNFVDVIAIHPKKRSDQPIDIRRFVVARNHNGDRTKKFTMRGKIDWRRSLRTSAARLRAPQADNTCKAPANRGPLHNQTNRLPH